MWPYFEQALSRFEDLERQLADPAVIADRARYTQAAKEHGALAKQVKPYLEYKKLAADLAEADKLAEAETDPEMKLYAQQELAELRRRQDALRARLEDFLLVEGEAFD